MKKIIMFYMYFLIEIVSATSAKYILKHLIPEKIYSKELSYHWQ